MPRVSVIVPVYNTAAFLEECLGSIAAQTLDDFEVVCVNDGSTDESASVLARYASKDDRFRIVDRANGGLSAARNTGVGVATGDYLLFVDSDDRLAGDALEQLTARADELDLDVLYYDADAFFDDDDVKAAHASYTTYYRRTSEYDGVSTGIDLVARMLDNEDYRPSACLQLLRRSFYLEAGLGFREGLLHEDNLFSFECALRSTRVAYLPAALYARRVRSGSIMTTGKGLKSFEGFFVTYLEVLRYAVRECPHGAAKRATRAICAEMYRQCISSFCSLDEDAQDTAGQIDDSVEAAVAHEALLKHFSQVRRARRLDARLTKATARLDRITGNPLYRFWRLLKRPFGS